MGAKRVRRFLIYRVCLLSDIWELALLPRIHVTDPRGMDGSMYVPC